MIASRQQRTASKLRIIRTLVAKDWRVARTTLIALVILGAACYALPLAAFWNTSSAQDRQAHLSQVSFDCAVAAIYMTGLLAAAFGGVAIAGERADGTAEFVDLLPVSRGQIVLGKWIVSFIAITGSAGVHAAIAVAIKYHASRANDSAQILPTGTDDYSVMLFGIISCMFAVGWLCGSFLNSAVVATGIAIGITMGVYVWILIALADGQRWGGLDATNLTALVTLCVAIPTLVGGTIYYLKRVKP